MSVTLLLRCNDLEETRDFYESVLEFSAEDSSEGTLTVAKFGDKVVFTNADLWGKPTGLTGTIYFTIPDVDRYFSVVRDKADVAWPVQDMAYGSREFGIEDCNGYHIAFQQKV